MSTPRTVNERIGDLRTRIGYSQRELADIVKIAPSQLSRIEKGQTKHISSDILIKLSGALGVSSDYILGLAALGELGLSEGAVDALVTQAADAEVLSRMLEHGGFPYLLRRIKLYVEGSSVQGDGGLPARIQKEGAAAEEQALPSRRPGERTEELEKIMTTFLAILRDLDAGRAGGVQVSAMMTRVR